MNTLVKHLKKFKLQSTYSFSINTPDHRLKLNMPSKDPANLAVRDFFLNHFDFQFSKSQNFPGLEYPLEKSFTPLFAMATKNVPPSEEKIALEPAKLYLLSNEGDFSLLIPREKSFVSGQLCLKIGDFDNVNSYYAVLEPVESLQVLNSERQLGFLVKVFLRAFFLVNLYFFADAMILSFQGKPVIIDQILAADFENFKQTFKDKN